jgi:hypothetical protein
MIEKEILKNESTEQSLPVTNLIFSQHLRPVYETDFRTYAKNKSLETVV